MDWKIEILKKMYITKEINRHITKWEEGDLYKSPSLFINYRRSWLLGHGSWGMWNVETHQLCVIEYDSMTHS